MLIRLIFLFLLFIEVTFVYAADGVFSSRNIVANLSMDEGLPHNYIDDIYKDSDGFLWIAMGGGGLSRYDGYEFVNYNVSSEQALKSNFITKVSEDTFHRLWIVSESGVDVLDLRSGLLVDVLGCDTLLMRSRTSYVTCDTQGNIWILNDMGAVRLSFTRDGAVNRTSHFFGDAVLRSVTACREIGGEMWIAVGNAIYAVNGDTATLVTKIQEGTRIAVIYPDIRCVWIGTNRGLTKLNRSINSLVNYVHKEIDPHSLLQNFVTDITLTPTGRLFVATLKGVCVYNPETDDFSAYPENVCCFVNCLLSDGDILWVATEVAGVRRITESKLDFSYDMHNSFGGSLSPNPVNAIYEDREGNLWVGTVEGGLNCRYKGSLDFAHYKAPLLSHNSVSDITEDREGNLWVGTWGGGLNVLEKKSHKVKQLLQDHEELDFIGLIEVDTLNDGLWIGAHYNVFFYDFKSKKILEPLEINAEGCVGSIIDDSSYMWIGTAEGLLKIDLRSMKGGHVDCQFMSRKLDQPNSQLWEKITCFCRCEDGSMYVGSNIHGFYRYKEGKYKVYSTKDGLINNSVRGILQDNMGRLWISTNNGLSCFDSSLESFTNYSKSNGLRDNQFYWNACGRSSDGRLYFGNVCGLLSINPESRKWRWGNERLAFTVVNVQNENVLQHKMENVSYSDSLLEFHEQYKSFSVEFSALEYEDAKSIRYAYRLRGFDDEWTDVSSDRRYAVYTNLLPGDYVFEVKRSVSSGEWTEPLRLNVCVVPFFYRTPWFILLVCILVALGVWGVFHWRVRTLRRQRSLLSKMVEDRTSELEHRNMVLKEQKEQIVAMSEEVQRLSADKLQFFTNITHEFRTPVTLIVGPIRRALKLSIDPQVREQLSYVERNSQYLLSLVNQLLDFRKVEAEGIEIELRGGDFVHFTRSLLEPFKVFAGERSVEVRALFHVHSCYMMFDQEAMRKILTNLLSNAVKFTPSSGKVSLYIADVGEELYISVSDTGTGIAAEDLEKIFNRFYQSQNDFKYPIFGQSGTGIGLYLCKRIVDMLGGRITAKNNPNRGSSFRIILPLTYCNRENVLQGLEKENVDKFSESMVEVPVEKIHVNSPTVLVVDDNLDMRKYLRSLLSENYNVLEAENGEMALRVIVAQRIDLVISDLMMPVMDGLELSRRIKADISISHIPLLMLTAKHGDEERVESYKIGVDAFLAKPFEEEVLLARVSNILDSRRRMQQKFLVDMNAESLSVDDDSRDKKFIDGVMHVVSENYQDTNFNVTELAEKMYISKSLLTKKMDSVMGITAVNFIRNYRLNVARELILKQRGVRNKTIGDISYEVGFNDPKYFTRCFVKQFNMQPSALLENDSVYV